MAVWVTRYIGYILENPGCQAGDVGYLSFVAKW